MALDISMLIIKADCCVLQQDGFPHKLLTKSCGKIVLIVVSIKMP